MKKDDRVVHVLGPFGRNLCDHTNNGTATCLRSIANCRPCLKKVASKRVENPRRKR